MKKDDINLVNQKDEKVFLNFKKFRRGKSLVRYLVTLILVFSFINSSIGHLFLHKVNSQEVMAFTSEDAELLRKGQILSPDFQLDKLAYQGPLLNPEEDYDEDGLLTREEIEIRLVNGRRSIVFKSHPMLKDTDGDGLSDAEEVRNGTNPLVWDVSARDMAMFMVLAYRDDAYIDKVLNHREELTELYSESKDTAPRLEYKMMHNELAPYWKAVRSYHVESNGFDAVIFKTKSDLYFLPENEVHIVAIRGTSGGQDIKEDGWIAVGGRPNQSFELPRVLNDLSSMPVKNVYVTGHSLGGWLAQYMAAYADISGAYPWFRNAYTFNAPNIRANAFQKRDFKDIRDKSIDLSNRGVSKHYATSNDPITNATGRMPNYTDVGRTDSGHGSRSYFEEIIGNRSDFQQGERNTMHREGRPSELYKTDFKDKVAEERPTPPMNELFPVEKKEEGHIDIIDPTFVEQVKELLLASLKPLPSRPHTQIIWRPVPSLDTRYGVITNTEIVFVYPDNTEASARVEYRYLTSKTQLEDLWSDIQNRILNGRTSVDQEQLYRPSTLVKWRRWKEDERLPILRSLSEAISNVELTPTEASSLASEARSSLARLINALESREGVVDKTSLIQVKENIRQVLEFDRTKKTPKSIEQFSEYLGSLNIESVVVNLQRLTANTEEARDASLAEVNTLREESLTILANIRQNLGKLKDKADLTLLEEAFNQLTSYLELLFDRTQYIEDEHLRAYEAERESALRLVNSVRTLLSDRDNISIDEVENPLNDLRDKLHSLQEKRSNLRIKPSKEALTSLYEVTVLLKEGVQLDRYTPHSINAYETALTNNEINTKLQEVKAVIDDASASEESVRTQLEKLQNLNTTLTNLQANLILKANKTFLNELISRFEVLIAELPSLKEANTPRTYTVYERDFLVINDGSYTEAKRLARDLNASEEEVEAIQLSLQNDINNLGRAKLNLVKKADKTLLQTLFTVFEDLISEAKERELRLDEKTPSSKSLYFSEMEKLNLANLNTEISHLLEDNDVDSTVVERGTARILSVLKQIQDLRQALVPLANKEQLITLNNQLVNLLNQNYLATDYIPTSYTAYEEAKNEALALSRRIEEFLQNKDVSQSEVAREEQEVSRVLTLLGSKISNLARRPDLTELRRISDLLTSLSNKDLTTKTHSTARMYEETLRQLEVATKLRELNTRLLDVNLTTQEVAQMEQNLRTLVANLQLKESQLKERADLTIFARKLDELKLKLNEVYSENIYTAESLATYNIVKNGINAKISEYDAFSSSADVESGEEVDKIEELTQDIARLESAQANLHFKVNKTALNSLYNELVAYLDLDLSPYTLASRNRWRKSQEDLKFPAFLERMRTILTNSEVEEEINQLIVEGENIKRILKAQKENLVLHASSLNELSSYVSFIKEFVKSDFYLASSNILKDRLQEKLREGEQVLQITNGLEVYSQPEVDRILASLQLAYTDVVEEKISFLEVTLPSGQRIKIEDPSSGLKGYVLRANLRTNLGGELAKKDYEAYDIYIESLTAGADGILRRLSLTPNFRLTLPRNSSKQVEAIYFVHEDGENTLEKIAQNSSLILGENEVSFVISHLSTYAVTYTVKSNSDNSALDSSKKDEIISKNEDVKSFDDLLNNFISQSKDDLKKIKDEQPKTETSRDKQHLFFFILSLVLGGLGSFSLKKRKEYL